MIHLNKWYRLDNAAKIFPPSKSKEDPKIFRFSVALKEDINKDILDKALEKTLLEYPIFKSILKKGIFWYYLEEVDKSFKSSLEDKSPCDEFKGSHLFEVTYYKKKINLEVDHSLTDGTGALAFLKSLTANYLDITYNIVNDEVINEGSIKESKEDAFTKYKSNGFKKVIKDKKAYKIKENKYIENRLKVIEGIVSTKKVKEEAKKYDLTITEYLTSVLIKSILDSKIKKSKKPIVITVPVNLRKYYPSYTVRNFFSVINITYSGKNNSLEYIAKVVKEEFNKKLDATNIKAKMNSTITIEKLFIIRLVPVLFKDLVLKIAYKIASGYQTMTLSNIGSISMPRGYDKYIDYFDVFISTESIQCCMCSYQDKMVISFSSKFIYSEIERNFFKTLSSKGIDVCINTNVLGEEK